MKKVSKNPERVAKRMIRVFQKCLKMVNGESKVYIWIVLSVAIVQGSIPALLLVMMQKIINYIQLNKKQVLLVVFAYIGIGLFQIMLEKIYEYYIIQFNLKFGKSVDEKILEKASQLSLVDYEDPEIYDIINRAQIQRGENLLNYLNSFFGILRDIIAVSGTILILVVYKWLIVIIVLFIPVIQYFYSLKIANMQYLVSISRTVQERKAWYINYLISMGSAFKEIRLYGLKEYFIKTYDRIRCKIIEQDLEIQKSSILMNLFLEVVDYLMSGVIFLYLVSQGLRYKILLGDVTAYIECVDKIKDGTTAIFSGLSNVFRSSLDIELLFTFLELKTDGKTKEEAEEIEEIKSIELQHIYYKYEGNEVYTLKDVSCSLEKGEILGIVGRNGSGKSTLLKIILGFYNNYEGTILVNGKDLRDIDKVSYLNKIGCLFQDYIKYEASVRENVGYGSLQDIDNDVKLQEIIKQVGLAKILGKEKGIDTIVGNWFGGYQLSFGEWQRLAIARAIVKNADFFVLDEPDSALDVNAEMDLLKIYGSYFKEKIGIVVTHKIQHIHFLANKIIVMKNGKVIENGTHHELLKEEGEYYHLYNIQFLTND